MFKQKLEGGKYIGGAVAAGLELVALQTLITI